MKLKRLFSLGLVLVLLLGVTSIAMAAESTSPLDCTALSADASGDGWNWSQSTQTLTITDLTLNITPASAADAFGIKLPTGATLVMNGPNVVNLSLTPSVTWGVGVYAEGDLTIIGHNNGSLETVRNGYDSACVDLNENLTLNNARLYSNGNGINWRTPPSPSLILPSGTSNTVASFFSTLWSDNTLTIAGDGQLTILQVNDTLSTAINTPGTVATGSSIIIVEAAGSAVNAPPVNSGNAVILIKEGTSDEHVLVQSGMLTTDYVVNNGETLSIPAGLTLAITNNAAIQNRGTIRNAGTLTVQAGASLVNTGTIENSGSIQNDGSIVQNGTLNGNVVTGTGTITVPPTGSSGGSAGLLRVSVTASAGVGGSITPSGKTFVARGSDVAFTIKPDIGYQISRLIVNGAEAEIPSGYSYTIKNIQKNTTITVSFEPFAEVLDPPKTGDASSSLGILIVILLSSMSLYRVGRKIG